MINYLKLVRFEMLCITLTPVVECKSIFIIIISSIYYQYNYNYFILERFFRENIFIAYNFIFQEELFGRSYCLLVTET